MPDNCGCYNLSEMLLSNSSADGLDLICDSDRYCVY